MAQAPHGDEATNGFTVVQAAIILDTTPNAIRKRARRGWSSAYKDSAGEWRIRLPLPPSESSMPLDAMQDVPRDEPRPMPRDEPRPMPRATLRQSLPSPAPSMDVAKLQAIIEGLTHERDRLEREIDTLHAEAATHAKQIERADTERAELRRLLGNAQMLLGERHEPVHHTAPDDSHEADSPSIRETSVAPLKTSYSVTQPRKPWWQWLLGRE